MKQIHTYRYFMGSIAVMNLMGLIPVWSAANAKLVHPAIAGFVAATAFFSVAALVVDWARNCAD